MSDESDVSDDELAFLDAEDAKMRRCPAWSDGLHCYVEVSTRKLGSGIAETRATWNGEQKSCACGKTVERVK